MKSERGQLILGHAQFALEDVPDTTVQACVTSPPYWQLRDYGVEGQIGQEDRLEDYVASLVATFDQVGRVLRDEGVLWLNLGDTYRDKQLQGVPWRVALALAEYGWRLRADVIWHKPNPMPESVTDRPVLAHEYLFLFSKSDRYFYDRDAIAEPAKAQNAHDLTGGYRSVPGQRDHGTRRAVKKRNIGPGVDEGGGAGQCAGEVTWTAGKRNARSVWTIPLRPTLWSRIGHFATFPYELPARCIEATTRPGDTVLDPFCGIGTTLIAAQDRGRKWIGIDINHEYLEAARHRVAQLSIAQEATRADT